MQDMVLFAEIQKLSQAPAPQGVNYQIDVTGIQDQ